MFAAIGNCILFLLILSSVCFGKTMIGEVVSITDGDTIKVLDCNNTEYKIRLYGIDCPERKQDFGQSAKKAISDMVYAKNVTVEYEKYDQYGRIIGKIYYDKLYVNLEMIKKGLAWWYYTYAPRDYDLRDAEQKARTEKIGIWSIPKAVPPWQFRRASRSEIISMDHKSQEFWVTDSTGMVHNKNCKWYKQSSGKLKVNPAGKDCGICGGRKFESCDK